MALIPFHEKFPETAERETRTVTLTGPAFGLPADEYAFLEFYCAQEQCDCRRVTFWVLFRAADRHVATISFGFDPEERLAGPYLEPLGRQTRLSRALLRLFVEVLIDDPDYLNRLYRHYVRVREAVDTRTGRCPACSCQGWGLNWSQTTSPRSGTYEDAIK